MINEGCIGTKILAATSADNTVVAVATKQRKLFVLSRLLGW